MVTENGFSNTSNFVVLLESIFSISFTHNAGIKAVFLGLFVTIISRILAKIGTYLSNMFMGMYVFIIERKRIKKISFLKKLLYIFTWPTFDSIGMYTSYIALFMNVTWKPIPHESKITIDDIKKEV